MTGLVANSLPETGNADQGDQPARPRVSLALLPPYEHLLIILREPCYLMRFAPALLLALFSAPSSLVAQSEANDVIRGRVTDMAGRPVADAQVEVISLQSKASRVKATDSTGHYRISFPENAQRYQLTAKKMGFSPMTRIVYRASTNDEMFVSDFQFAGAPLALSMVEVTGDPTRRMPTESPSVASGEATVPNPVAEILARKDSLHLSAVQIVALTDLAESLYSKNSALFRRIHTLLTKSRENGDPSAMSGTVAMILQEAATNSDRALHEAEKLLRPEQWTLLPAGITTRNESPGSPAR
jgi:hypothetical protein